ncbi:ATP-grasp domain-containing protein [Litorivicinus sp.]|nr:ATP-grasp domain-containing protein [Litorivicinus sp.]
MKILILGVGGNVSIGIVRAIRQSALDAYIIGACVSKNAPGFAFCDAIAQSPYADSDQFFPWLENMIEKNNIEVVLSGVEEINAVLARNKNHNSECKYLVPELENQNIFKNKLRTVEWLAKHSIDHPKTLDLQKGLNFQQIVNLLKSPFIVKPKEGKGSQGISVIDTEREYEKINCKEDYVAQELIGDADSEYTCGVYKSKFGYTEILIMRRQLSKGSTNMAQVVSDHNIFSYVKRVADCLDTTSPFNVQLRLCKFSKRPVCFEINMRLSGTTPMRHKFGFKDCQVWIKESILNKNYQSDFTVQPGTLVRYESEAFLPPETPML